VPCEVAGEQFAAQTADANPEQAKANATSASLRTCLKNIPEILLINKLFMLTVEYDI
jgi:hypothetical protein